MIQSRASLHQGALARMSMLVVLSMAIVAIVAMPAIADMAADVASAIAAAPKPIVVYMAGPMSKSLIVRTVLYDNGLVVYDDDAVRQDHAGLSYGDIFRVSPVYHSVVLAKAEYRRFFGAIDPDALTRVRQAYQMDYPWYYKVIAWPNGEKKEIECGGFMYREGTDPDSEKIVINTPHGSNDPQTVARDGLPTELLRAMDALQYFTSDNIVDFPETTYALVLRRVDGARHPRQWPSSFPIIDAASGTANSDFRATVSADTFRQVSDTEWRDHDDVYRAGSITWRIVPVATAFLPNSRMWMPQSPITDGAPPGSPPANQK